MTSTTLITGANRGIGLEFARQYAGVGWRVFACCRRPRDAAELQSLSTGSSGLVTVHELDVTRADQIKAMVEVLGHTAIDILINNAGIYGQTDANFGNTDESRWLETFRVNAIAPIKMMEAFVDAVAISKRKLIASITSRMGSIADNTSGGSYVYRSSKAALNAVAKSAANDLKDRGVTVVVLHPGWVRTDMGGPNGAMGAEQSVAKMRVLLDRLTIAQSGKFFSFDGSSIPW